MFHGQGPWNTGEDGVLESLFDGSEREDAERVLEDWVLERMNRVEEYRRLEEWVLERMNLVEEAMEAENRPFVERVRDRIDRALEAWAAAKWQAVSRFARRVGRFFF